MSIIIFLIILAALILVHEFGHFIVAKRGGIRVDEFGLGFPPRITGIKRGETMYSVNWIPFGGFVKIFGEDPDDESLHGPDSARSFINKSKITQASVLAAGIAFNIFFAWALLSASFALGIPSPADAIPGATVRDVAVVITDVLEESPAASAGIMVGDVLIGVSDGTTALENITIEGVQTFIAARGGEELTVTFTREEVSHVLQVAPTPGIVSERPAIGISMDMLGTLRLPIHEAIWEGGKLTFTMIGVTAVGLGALVVDAISGTANLSQVTGPVGIVGLVGDAAQFGLVNLLGFTAFISVNLAIINLIPFPALDGGRLFFLLIETVRRKPLSPKVVNLANSVGFVVLILLMLVVTYSDIAKLL